MKGTDLESKIEARVDMENRKNYKHPSGKDTEPNIENESEFRNPNQNIEKKHNIEKDQHGENGIWHGISSEHMINGIDTEILAGDSTVEEVQSLNRGGLNNKVFAVGPAKVKTSITDEAESQLQVTNFSWQNEGKLSDLEDLTVPITPEITNKMVRCTQIKNDKDQVLVESKEFTVTPSTSRCTYSTMSCPVGKLNSTAVLPDCILHVNKTKEECSSSNGKSDGVSPRNESLFANSDDSLSSDNMSSASNKGILNKNLIESCSNEILTNSETVPDDKHLSKIDMEPVPSTSCNSQAQYSNICEDPVKASNIFHNNIDSECSRSMRMQSAQMSTSDSLPNINIRGKSSAYRTSGEEDLLLSNIVSKPNESESSFYCKMSSSDYDDDTCVDCEVADEEICTCLNYLNDAKICLDEELLSKAIDITNYIHTSSETYSKESIVETTAIRKRKLLDPRLNESASNCSIGRKRIALDSEPNQRTPVQTEKLSQIERRFTPRSLIPTKDNPPPELESWITQFQRWSHVERLVAVDKLIENCEPTQVRHMMKVIEPQFQRDFISLLPKELALQVLSYLDPRDLLRAAQTCRSWRFLCDDNLLWKEKCKQAQIMAEPNSDKPRRGRAGNMPAISSPWKAAFLRQHIIEMNWRSKPIREPKILKGHDDHVITCLQFYGNRIVSGSDDNTLKVWSAVSGKCLRTLVGHTGGVWSSQMSGNIIISGSTDRTLKVWNMDTGQCIHTLQGHTSTVRCMHLHGRKVVSGSRDATLRVWDIENGTCLHVLVGHLAAVRCVQYDGKLIVSGAYDYMVKVWNPERQECLHTLQGHTNRVYSLQFDGLHIVSGSLDTSIRVWDAETGSCKHTLMGHQSLTSGMELRQNILVSGNADSTVKVWDISSGQCLQTLSGPNKHQSAVTCLQFNTRFVITSSDDGTVKLWDVKTGDFIRNLVSLDSGGSGGVVWRIRASDTKLICAVGSRNGTEETKLMVLDFDVDGACAKCC